jgi:hypothetical protein
MMTAESGLENLDQQWWLWFCLAGEGDDDADLS